MVAAPDLTLKLTDPSGTVVDLTAFLAWSGANQQATITQNFGRQGDTAQLVLVDEFYTASRHIDAIAPVSQISLYDNNISKSLFAGIITDPALAVTGPNRNEWVLQCTDYTFYADHAISRGVFANSSIDQIVIALTNLAACGVSAVSTRDGGFVHPAALVPSVSFGWKSLSQMWKSCAQLAGGVAPFGWYVDENRRLHFYDQANASSSGVTFTTSPTVAGSATEGHITLDTTFQYEWDATSLENRILVQGATQTINTDVYGNATDEFYGDGVTTSWPLRYTLSGAAPSRLTVNGVGEVVGASGSGATFEVSQNANGQWFLTTASAPPAGSVILLWYNYQVPIIAQINDTASQANYNGPNGGVFSAFVNDATLTTTPMALARAQQLRTEYSYAVERITFTTTEDWLGWVRAGETCRIVCGLVPDSQNDWSYGIDSTFLVIQNQITFGAGGYRRAQITAVRL
jgi:hypothetical protein